MPNFWKVLNLVIQRSDIIIEVLDARMPDKTRNAELEDKAGGKPIVYVLNKCDLISQKEGEELKKQFKGKGIFVSTKKYYGIKMLKTRINQLATERRTIVGVVGYPNTGKSSLINAISSRSAARTSAHAGFTKGMQMIKMKQGIYLLDTPGVIPYGEDDEIKHGLIATINPTEVKNPDVVAMKIIRMFLEKDKSALERTYGIVIGDEDESDILENIGKRSNTLKKGGTVDERRAGIKVIQDWQRGKIT